MKLTCVLIAAMLLLAVCQLDSADATETGCKKDGSWCWIPSECCIESCLITCWY
uniref:Conotoxin Cal6.27 n=1 Tax=Californiconus californicus TaxID=1736779 RepID=O1627_CONCL|nr:RecName: Full=Conotoxin Cal6.27; AltName: Full=O1_cal6.27; Flags: Precursor [Californiconus californicus]